MDGRGGDTNLRMVSLLLGPVLRHVGERDATVWVETDGPCLVEVCAGSVVGRERTFSVAGHHYALVVLGALAAGSSTPYEIRLDGSVAWPIEGSPFPASRIRTVDPARPITILFGSCRESPALQRKGRALVDPDMLVAYAQRMTSQEHERWPDLLVLMGDQIYADDTSPEMREFIKGRRDIRKGPGDQVADFEEYTQLYRESWSDPTVRWLLSTLPTSMIFDDHDVRDDWNTSDAWRRDMQETDWWEERITGALMSYWIYQHLGNLSPAGLAASEIYEAVRGVPDAEPVLRSFAQAADREADGAKGTMWSYRRDLGAGPDAGHRFPLRPGAGRRSPLHDQRPRVRVGGTPGRGRRFEHLVVVTSMPWLLPRALHDLESWNEALCAGSRGRIFARSGEWVRRAVDLEHWAAFRKSFDRLAALFARVGRGEHGGEPPATITVLSGDVHHSYISEADYPAAHLAGLPDHLLADPQHDPRSCALVFHMGWSNTVERVVRALDRPSRRPASAHPLASPLRTALREHGREYQLRGPNRASAPRAFRVDAGLGRARGEPRS